MLHGLHLSLHPKAQVDGCGINNVYQAKFAAELLPRMGLWDVEMLGINMWQDKWSKQKLFELKLTRF